MKTINRNIFSDRKTTNLKTRGKGWFRIANWVISSFKTKLIAAILILAHHPLINFDYQFLSKYIVVISRKL